MTKYYYTDPLASAWMAHKHGMVFTWDNGETSHDANGATFILYSMLCYDEIGFRHAADKYYIHPDSLHLLKPQEGDVGKGSDGELYHYVGLYEQWLSIATVHDCDYEAKGEVSIIQRNGIAFMTPEVEE